MTEDLRAGKIRLDRGRHELDLAGRPVRLNPKEFAVLEVLLAARGELVARPVLLERVWGYSAELGMSTRLIDQYVSRIRRKLGSEGRRLVTVPTLGYRIV